MPAEHAPHAQAEWLESQCLDRAMEADLRHGDEQAAEWWERAWRATGDASSGLIGHAEAAEQVGTLAMEADSAGRPVVAGSLRSCARAHRDFGGGQEGMPDA